MPAYAIGHLRTVAIGPDIVEYLERIDDTLEPYEGRFIIHGAKPDVLEGDWAGDLIVIEFADLDRARAWYRSREYQRIVPLRARNADGEILLIDGVENGHRATDVLEA